MRRSRLLMAVLIVLLGIAMFVVWLSGDDGRSERDTDESQFADAVRVLWQPAKPFSPDEFARAVRAHESGELVARDGVVLLSESLAGVTDDGRMYVTTASPHGPVYLFITWRGKGSNLRGYLYHPSHQSGSAGGTTLAGAIEVLGPTIYHPFHGKVTIEIENSPAPGWYEVKRDLD